GDRVRGGAAEHQREGDRRGGGQAQRRGQHAQTRTRAGLVVEGRHHELLELSVAALRKITFFREEVHPVLSLMDRTAVPRSSCVCFGARSSSSFVLARDSRDLTVPTGMPSASAASA